MSDVKNVVAKLRKFETLEQSDIDAIYAHLRTSPTFEKYLAMANVLILTYQRGGAMVRKTVFDKISAYLPKGD